MGAVDVVSEGAVLFRAVGSYYRINAFPEPIEIFNNILAIRGR